MGQTNKRRIGGLHHLFTRISRNQMGVTSIEYGLISSIVATALVVGLATAGPTLAGVFQSIATSLEQAIASI